jgi:hypothetical protein
MNRRLGGLLAEMMKYKADRVLQIVEVTGNHIPRGQTDGYPGHS